MYKFAAGFDRLISTLVTEWTSLGPAASESMRKAFGDIAGTSSNTQHKFCADDGIGDKNAADASSDSESSTETGGDRRTNAYEFRRRPL